MHHDVIVTYSRIVG